MMTAHEMDLTQKKKQFRPLFMLVVFNLTVIPPYYYEAFTLYRPLYRKMEKESFERKDLTDLARNKVRTKLLTVRIVRTVCDCRTPGFPGDQE